MSKFKLKPDSSLSQETSFHWGFFSPILVATVYLLVIAAVACTPDDDDDHAQNSTQSPETSPMQSPETSPMQNPDPDLRGPVFLWLSPSRYMGDVSARADSICINASSSIALPAARAYTHKAMLGYTGAHPRDLPIPNKDSRSVQRPDGTQIIATYQDYFDSSKTWTNSIVEASDESSVYYWNGLGSSGNINENCSDWASASDTLYGAVGDPQPLGTRFFNFIDACNTENFILCASY